MTRTETIQAAMLKVPVTWGLLSEPGLALKYDPTTRSLYPWNTRHDDRTGRYNIDAEGKVVVEWMRAIRNVATLDFVLDELSIHRNMQLLPATDRTDWLYTLAEAINEVMGQEIQP